MSRCITHSQPVLIPGRSLSQNITENTAYDLKKIVYHKLFDRKSKHERRHTHKSMVSFSKHAFPMSII